MPLVLLAVFFAAPAWAGEAVYDQAKPVGAAEAEEQVGQTRDVLTDMMWLKTDDYWHVGEWDEVIRLCHQIVQVDPHFIEAYTGAAYLLYSTDKDEEASELFRAGIAANPKSYDLRHEFGMYYMYRHKWDLAVEQFRESVSLGAPPAMQHMYGNALERAGRPREALEAWQEMRKRFPDDPVVKQHIEQLNKELGKRRS